MRRVLLLSPETLPYTRWVEALRRKRYAVEIFSTIEEAGEKVLFNLPDLLLVAEALKPDLVHDLVFALKCDLSLATLPVILIIEPEKLHHIQWQNYFVDDFLCEGASEEEVVSRVELAFVRSERLADNNPLTGLPGNTSILRKIEEVIRSEESWAVGYVDLDNFKPFNDAYGFSRGDEVIRMLARILVTTVDLYAGPRGFVGHIGGDDFVFVVPLEVAEKMSREIIQKFDQLIINFVDPEDRERGCLVTTDRQGVLCRMPWPSVSIAIVPVWKDRFHHYGEVAAIAAQLKHYVKRVPGSIYLVDRRK
ncbi:diguanylate cyclase domain-containing protein [Thermosulfurimonas sp. F29]|uniref:GGDEF domain-containing protein n=1 Tax=Thermosulfurimonas sp. F29 TaxID=2867247 RepID=UPI001C82A586|nr:diguanylate cyclase [Thermosulfurimonas sp. F29]MBX6422293.1 diguanylate cyclase [Thermosulfurimonas sp. F29]